MAQPRAPRQRQAPANRSGRRAPPPQQSQVSQYWPSIAQVATIPGYAVLPLRLFLGGTFLYAGYQKLTDPGFFTLGAPTYIGTQMHGMAQGSPIGPLMAPFLAHAVAVGALTIAAELGIGLLILLGLFTRLAALGGLFLNFVFFLTASWHTYPFFYGSDIVFVVAWLTLILTGPGGYCLDTVLYDQTRSRTSPFMHKLVLGPVPLPRAAPTMQSQEAAPAPYPDASLVEGGRASISRGEALIAGVAALGLLVLGLVPRGRVGSQVAAALTPSSGAAAPTPSTGNAQPSGRVVGNTSQIPINSAISFNDPRSGDPAVVVHTDGSSFYAYDAVCTHAGCTVMYDNQYKVLVCPCHGGAFDPAHGAQVVAGPPPAPLSQIPITIDSKGNISVA